jgi:hypothetical protein
MRTQKGYILILTMMMMAAASAIVIYVFNKGMVYAPLATTVMSREKAQMLAFSGVAVAQSLTSYVPPKKEKEKAEPAQSKEESAKADPDKTLLTTLLPSINRFQEFNLKLSVDGYDGELKICIMCEEGKINLNKIYDFKKHAFINDNWKKLLQAFCLKIEQETKTQNLFGVLENFLKKRQVPLDDITELLLIPEFAPFKNKLFYEPTITAPKEKGKGSLFLTDIFTVHSSTDRLEPWLFSNSLLILCGLPTAQPGEIDKRKAQLKEWLKSFKKKADWKTDWNTLLKPVFQKELQSLPKGLDSVLSTVFEPHIFSVLVIATVNGVTQKVYALIERIKRSQNNQIMYDSVIKKWYII